LFPAGCGVRAAGPSHGVGICTSSSTRSIPAAVGRDCLRAVARAQNLEPGGAERVREQAQDRRLVVHD
jgi:hypothetical protein